MKRTLLAGVAACMAFSALPVAAADSQDFDWWLDARARYEHSDQDNALDDAHASTVRARLGVSTPSFGGFTLMAEAEHISALDDRYNSTTNGEAQYSVVVDPEDTELNRATLTWRGARDTSVTIGRQRIVLDNARFIGNVGWRQNEQTFDAVMVRSQPAKDWNVQVGYIDKVRRIFGPDSPQGTLDLSAPIVRVAYSGFSLGTVVAYAHGLDYDDQPTASHRNIGVKLSGSREAGKWSIGYDAEFARQTDSEDAPDFSTSYHHLALTAGRNGWKVRIGQEVLGSDNGRAFQTPLATGHAFNGWTDQFLGTPGEGLEDNYVRTFAKWGKTKAQLAMHWFSADRGGADFGRELEAVITRPFGKRWSAGFKAARYDANTRGVDTTKAWLFVQLRY